MVGLDYEVAEEKSLSSATYDGIVLVSVDGRETQIPKELKTVLDGAAELDSHFHEAISILKVDLPCRRLIYSPTGPLDKEYDDVRSFGEAAKAGVLRALKAGVKAPLLVLLSDETFKMRPYVTLLGAFEALYVNIQLREDRPELSPKVKKIGVWSSTPDQLKSLIETAKAFEAGRIVARDIGGPDPERMTPIKVEEYVKKALSDLKIEVISDEAKFEKEYPLFAAVNRAASVIPRHKGRIIYITYEGSSVEETLLIVGKGVTYDTGGADIKYGGIMAGMCRDKCGAAATAGFMKVVSILKPPKLKVIAAMPMVRNSVGENAYVSDEMIMSRSGKRVRVGNTDAEGRMIMADVLCYMREKALECKNPHLMTIATLTGHAVRTVGPGYTIGMDNGPARKNQFIQGLQQAGDEIGDMLEVSTIRREDFATHKGKVDGEDVLQALVLPSSQSKRGHQGPAAFLIMTSGLENHGLGSKQPLPYTHLDIAGSAGDVPEDATGAPILALSNKFILSRP